MLRRSLLLCSIVALAFTAGCDSTPPNPDTFPVTGTVTYKGSPVEGATVVLSPIVTGTKGAVGNTDASGNFELMTFEDGDGAMPGEYNVKVFKYELTAEPAIEGGGDDDGVVSDEEIAAEEESYGGQEDEASRDKNLLPDKYANAATSGIKHTVTEAPTTLTIDLK